jgi:PadR family transcriptional regulator AphA
VSAYFEFPPQPAGEFDAAGVVTACIESGTDRLLLDDGALPPEFFDLSTRVAGTLVQRLTQYEIRMAAVVPDPSAHSRSFQEFAREANTGRWFRFFPNREQAVEWLSSE